MKATIAGILKTNSSLFRIKIFAASDRKSVADFLSKELEEQNSLRWVRAVEHRVVHGMQRTAPELVTQELPDELHRISPYAPEYQPREIVLIEAFRQRHRKSLLATSFDTPFQRDTLRVAKPLPTLPRYAAKGV